MQTVKIVVTGPFSAGKTQFIQTVSEIPVVATERRMSDDTTRAKKEITIAMDFGRITVDRDMVLYLFGTPGQKRFDFMREILAEGMLGFIVLVDSARPETFREAKLILSLFRSYSETPYVIAANKQDLSDAWPPEDLRFALGAEAQAKIVPCTAKDKDSVKNVLLELLSTILERMDAQSTAAQA